MRHNLMLAMCQPRFQPLKIRLIVLIKRMKSIHKPLIDEPANGNTVTA
jgi:hypothetical protein